VDGTGKHLDRHAVERDAIAEALGDLAERDHDYAAVILISPPF
jgi:hypothetical protein